MSHNETKIIKQSITQYLSKREHSKAELLQKLRAKQLPSDLCEQQIQTFAEQNLQSDERFADSLARTSYAKGKGPNMIRMKLKQHDIASEIIANCIANPDFDWYQSAHHVRVKKYGESLPSDFNVKQKQMRFLQYRGFEQDHISSLFD